MKSLVYSPLWLLSPFRLGAGVAKVNGRNIPSGSQQEQKVIACGKAWFQCLQFLFLVCDSFFCTLCDNLAVYNYPEAGGGWKPGGSSLFFEHALDNCHRVPSSNFTLWYSCTFALMVAATGCEYQWMLCNSIRIFPWNLRAALLIQGRILRLHLFHLHIKHFYRKKFMSWWSTSTLLSSVMSLEAVDLKY